MTGGLRPLINPGTPANEIDIEGTREYRELIRHLIRQRNAEEERIRRGHLPDFWLPNTPRFNPKDDKPKAGVM